MEIGSLDLGRTPNNKKSSGSRALPEVARMVNTRLVKSLLGDERPLSAERDSQDALIFGRVDSGRTQALCLAERDLLPVKRGLNARVHHINRETEACHRIPVGHRAYAPEVEAGVAAASHND